MRDIGDAVIGDGDAARLALDIDRPANGHRREIDRRHLMGPSARYERSRLVGGDRDAPRVGGQRRTAKLGEAGLGRRELEQEPWVTDRDEQLAVQREHLGGAPGHRDCGVLVVQIERQSDSAQGLVIFVGEEQRVVLSRTSQRRSRACRKGGRFGRGDALDHRRHRGDRSRGGGGRGRCARRAGESRGEGHQATSSEGTVHEPRQYAPGAKRIPRRVRCK